MSAWLRATIEQRCGACGRTILTGTPVLVLQPRALTRRLVRGECCAGPAPPDLPDRVVTAAVAPLSLQRLGLLPLDFTRRGHGGVPERFSHPLDNPSEYEPREPGCDD